MTNSNYEIRVINHNPEEVYNAIEGLEESDYLTLFKNCKSYLRVGNKRINIQFDTALISEDKDRMVLLMKDGLLGSDSLESILNKKNIKYNSVTFMDSIPMNIDDQREICFAREESNLRSALKDSKEKGISVCGYYPDMSGRFELRYPLEDNHLVPFERQAIKGVVLLEDKMILMMSNSKDMNLKYHDVIKALYEEDIVPMIVMGEYNIEDEKVKQYIKEQ